MSTSRILPFGIPDSTRNTLVRQHLKADERRFDESASVTGFGALTGCNPAPNVAPTTAFVGCVAREEAQKQELVRACLVVRNHLRPTKVDVIEALDAVESMAYSFMEEGGWFGDVESAFERVRGALEVRPQPTFEQAKQQARDNWNGYGDEHEAL
jgi:hypothetical protein